MSRKISMWLDSGASIHAKYEVVMDFNEFLEENSLDEGGWLKLDEETREEIVKEYAWAQADWGYSVY